MQSMPLSEIAEINPGPSGDVRLHDVCSFVPMEAIDETLGEISKSDAVPVADVTRGYTPFQQGDVLFAKITPCMENGKCAVARDLTNGIGFGSTELHVIRPRDIAVADWMFYFLRQQPVRKQLEGRMTGSAGQRRVPIAALGELRIPLPPLAEQRRIAAILRAADEERRRRRYTQSLSDGLLGEVFVRMFGDPATNPYGWPVAPLGDAIDAFDAGINFPPVPEYAVTSIWRVLKISAVTWGDFDPSESKPISASVSFDDRLIVRKGDLLMSRANTAELVGAVCLVRDEPANTILPDKIWRLRFKQHSKLSPIFALHALRHPSVRRVIADLATGTSGSMKNISMEKAALIRLPIPPMPLQERFSEIVTQHHRARRQQQESARQTEHLFDTLLHCAFAGEL